MGRVEQLRQLSRVEVVLGLGLGERVKGTWLGSVADAARPSKVGKRRRGESMMNRRNWQR